MDWNILSWCVYHVQISTVIPWPKLRDNNPGRIYFFVTSPANKSKTKMATYQRENGSMLKMIWRCFFSYSFYWAWQFPLTCEFTRGFFDGAPSFLKGVFVTSLTWKMVGGPRMCRLGDLLYIWMDNKKYGNFGYPQYPYPNLIWG